MEDGGEGYGEPVAQYRDAVDYKTAQTTNRDVALLVMSLSSKELTGVPTVEYSGSNHVAVTRNVVKFAQALDAVNMLTRNYQPCPQLWNRTDQYEPLAETTEVIYQGLSLTKLRKKGKTGVKIELLDAHGVPHTSAPPSEEDVSEEDTHESSEDEDETIIHGGFGDTPQKTLQSLLKTKKSSSSSSSSFLF